MKLIAEDVKNPAEENECGEHRNSDSTAKLKWKIEPGDLNKNEDPAEGEILEDNSIMSAYQEGGGNKREKKVVLRKKEDMEKTTATMDALIQGVVKCRIQGEGEGQKAAGKEDKEESELTGKLSQLAIEAKEVPSKHKEPKEDDERGSNRSSESEEEENNNQRPRARLVKLEPPVPSKESNDDNESEEVITRGPAGIPVYHNKRSAGNNFYGKQFVQHQQMPVMPDNFPNYQQMYTNNNGSIPMAAMGKRCIEPQDLYPEAPKYVRPQLVSMPQNNLDAPGTPLPTTPISPTSFRPHSTVCVNQMAGGTVFAAEEQQNPALCQLPPPHQQQMPGWGSTDYQQRLYPQQDSCGCPGNNDFLEVAVNAEEEGRLDSEEIERLLFNAVAANQLKNDSVICKDMEDLWSNSSSPQMAPVPMPTRPAGTNQQGGDYIDILNHPQQGDHTHDHTHDLQTTLQDKQQQQQQSLLSFYPPLPLPITTNNNSNGYTNPMKHPFPHRNSLEDNGYSTDQSPSHESSQFSPSPSSIMAASPASYASSSPPHHQIWSPPPSNMSLDSGVASPMSEDGKSPYGQIKSPRSVRSMSEMASPPHPSSAIFMPQPHQSPNPYDFGNQSQDIVPPLDFPWSCKLDFTVDPSYKDPFIDANLPELDLAVQVADNDVKHQLSKQQQLEQQLEQQQLQQQHLWQQQVVKKELRTPVVQPIVKPGTAMKMNPAMNPTTAQTPSVQQGKSMVPQQQIIFTNGNRGNADNNFGPKTTIVADSRMLPNTAAAVVTSSIPTTLAFSASVAPMVNRNGKVQIPPNNPRGQHLSNMMLSTLIVMPPSKPRFQPIAPKDPTKQNGTPTVNGNNSSGNNNNGGAAAPAGRVASSGNGGQGTAATPAPTSRISPENILNQARRFVADHERRELQDKDEEGDTILHLTMCQTDGPYLIKALLERLEREDLMWLIDAQNNNGQTPLYLAVRINDHGKVKVLVEQGADVTTYADYNGTQEKKAAIHCASSNGHTYLQTLRILLSASGMDVEQRDSQGYTALHCAILNHGKTTVIHKKKKSETIEINSIPIVEALVAAGANPNLPVQNGRTALMIALETGCLDLFEKLLSLVNPTEREKCLKTQDFKGNSVLKIADRLKGTLEAADQLRLQNCLKRNAFQRNSGSGSGC